VFIVANYNVIIDAHKNIGIYFIILLEKEASKTGKNKNINIL
jgi:hypothetical protein